MSGPRTPAPVEAYVFDTSPLVSFSGVRRLDVLEELYAGRALWTIEVRDEIRRGVGTDPHLQDVLDAAWLPPPVRTTDVRGLREIEHVRWALSGRSGDSRRHLGEAATMVVARRRGGVAVLDDRDARRFARATGVPFVGTVGILQAAVGAGCLTGAEAWVIIQQLKAQGRGLPPTVSREWFEP